MTRVATNEPHTPDGPCPPLDPLGPTGRHTEAKEPRVNGVPYTHYWRVGHTSTSRVGPGVVSKDWARVKRPR